MDVADLLPCANTISKSIQQACEQESLKLKDTIESVMYIGGAATCDGLTKKKYSGKKYYDFVIYYIKKAWRQPPVLRSQVLFLTPFRGDTGDK